MDIIDNFGIPSKQREGFNPWLENILDIIKSFHSNRKTILRLTGERSSRSIIYRLRNSENKTYAEIYKRKKIYYIHLYKRDLPDINKSIKPTNILLGSHVFIKGDIEDQYDMAKLIGELITSDTDYSLRKINKIKVSPFPLKDQKTLIGGRITGIVYKENQMVNVVIENGLASFNLNLEKFSKHRLSLLKYIIFNDRDEMVLINSPEFDFYYEMKIA